MKVKHNRHLFSGLSLWDGDFGSSHIAIRLLRPAVAQGQSDLVRRVSNQRIAFKINMNKSNLIRTGKKGKTSIGLPLTVVEKSRNNDMPSTSMLHAYMLCGFWM